MVLETRRSLRAAVIGMVFGDGTISKAGSMCIKHSVRQAEYLRYKAGIVQALQHRPVHISERIFVTNYGNFPAIRFITNERPLYRRLRKILYPGGVKTFTRKSLDFLDARGIALWYMDDGSVSVKKNHGKPSACELTLNTYCSIDENQTIIDYFTDRWGLRFGLNKSKNAWRLRMGTIEGRKFGALIAPYIIPSMQYKLLPLFKRRGALLLGDEEIVRA